MWRDFLELIPEAAVVLLSVSLAFGFNFYLQQRLLKAQNKDKAIDLLLGLLEEQKRFYGDYWERDARGGDSAMPIGRMMLQTQFDLILRFADEKYRLKNIAEIQKGYTIFCMLAASGAFQEINRKADLKRSKDIHIAANALYARLLENKI